MDSRFSIDHALRQSSDGTPVGESAERYRIQIPGQQERMTPVPVATNKYDFEGKDIKTPSGQENSGASSLSIKTDSTLSQKPWIPSYLRATAYGERFDNFSRDHNQQGQHTTIDHQHHEDQLHLPKIFPSRAAAEAESSDNDLDGPKLRREIGVPPLPSSWVTKDKTGGGGGGSHGIKTLENGLKVVYAVDAKGDEKQCCALKTNHPISRLCGIYYYEVEVLENGPNDCISIGMCGPEASLTKIPGQDVSTWGYHGDDGRIMACQGTSKDFGPRFGAGDIIGCGVNFRKNSIFYTKNGLFLGVAFRDVTGQLYPSIGLRDGQSIMTNFGQQQFRYDINKFIRDEKFKVLDNINSNFVTPSGMDHDDPTEFIQQLVASYFSHVGFLETAKEFERERTDNDANGSEEMDIDDRQQQHDVEIERQTIRQLILQGNMDNALECLERAFPSVLANNDLIYFKLRCRKFVELFKRTLEPKTQSGGDVDDLSQVIQYGEQLRSDYKDDPRTAVSDCLRNIFSLYAYPDLASIASDPLVAHLLDNGQLIPLADEVNSEILVSQGKPPVPSLQRLAQHATQLTWELADNGVDDADLINVKQDFLD